MCQEAARNLVQRESRPVPAAVVLPLPSATRVTTLPDWPEDDGARFDLLDRFATDVMRPNNAPCYGFLAEGTADAQGTPVDVVVVAYGARGKAPHVTAAALTEGGLEEFVASEPLTEAAFPFLSPLQHAADDASPPDAFSG